MFPILPSASIEGLTASTENSSTPKAVVMLEWLVRACRASGSTSCATTATRASGDRRELQPGGPYKGDLIYLDRVEAGRPAMEAIKPADLVAAPPIR